MKRHLITCAALMAMAALATAAQAAGKTKIDGKAKFTEHCTACHPDGGNIVNPKKTLKKADLNANGVKSAKDIVAKMRKPGPGMTPFDAKDVSDAEAKAIADYILKTFK
jgi:cytochrome c6